MLLGKFWELQHRKGHRRLLGVSKIRLFFYKRQCVVKDRLVSVLLANILPTLPKKK